MINKDFLFSVQVNFTPINEHSYEFSFHIRFNGNMLLTKYSNVLRFIRWLRDHSGEIYADEWGCRWIDFFFLRILWFFGDNYENFAILRSVQTRQILHRFEKKLSFSKSWDSQQHYGASLVSQRFVKVLILTPFSIKKCIIFEKS